MSKFLVGLDDGHGINTDGKRTAALKEDILFNGKVRKKGTVIHENEFNELIMKKTEKHLKRCGISYVELAPTTADTPLATRANTANKNKCDIVVSYHANGLNGVWQTKAYGLVVIKTKGCQSKTSKLADIAYKHLKQVDFYSNGETKYGVKIDTDINGFTLAILRQTNMPAILIELGFMDNWEDVKIMCTDKFQEDCAVAITKAICEYANIKYIEESVNPPTENKPNYNWNNGDYNIKVRATANLNLRTGRGTNFDIITTIKKGTVFTLGYVNSNWGSTWTFGKCGYISCDYIERV